MGSAVNSTIYIINTAVYRKVDPGKICRYIVSHDLCDEKYFVLHADFFSINEVIDFSYFDQLSIERMFDIDIENISWFASIEAAIQAHDKDFENEWN